MWGWAAGPKHRPQDGRVRSSGWGAGQRAGGERAAEQWTERLGVGVRGAPSPLPPPKQRDQLRLVPSCGNFGFVCPTWKAAMPGGAWHCGLEPDSLSLIAALWLTSPESLASLPYLFSASISSAGKRG